MLTFLALMLAVVAIAWMGLASYGRFRWASATQALLAQLEAARLPHVAARFDARELDGLPTPVQSYFRAVLKDGQAIVVAATFQHTGTFNVTALASGERWIPFTSEQRVVTHGPGFVWNARMVLVPGVTILVHDAFARGEGTLHAAALGLFSLADQHGTGEIARGELMRYMMEAVWYPTALLPSQGVKWVAVDDVSADATMVDGDISMTMRFTFGADGVIESVRADARAAMVGDKEVMMPWEGRMSDYQECAGMRLPLTAEAAWLTPVDRKPYWRGTIASSRYELARQG